MQLPHEHRDVVLVQDDQGPLRERTGRRRRLEAVGAAQEVEGELGRPGEYEGLVRARAALALSLRECCAGLRKKSLENSLVDFQSSDPKKNFSISKFRGNRLGCFRDFFFSRRLLFGHILFRGFKLLHVDEDGAKVFQQYWLPNVDRSNFIGFI